MANCSFIINIDGFYQEFSTEEELNSFLRDNKKQLVTSLLTGLPKFSMDLTIQEQVKDRIEALGNKLTFIEDTHKFLIDKGGDSVELTSVTKFITTAKLLGKQIAPELRTDEYRKRLKEELLAKRDDKNEPIHTPAQADELIDDLFRKHQAASFMGTSWHKVAQLFFEDQIETPADIKELVPEAEPLDTYSLRRYTEALGKFRSELIRKHGEDSIFITEAMLFDDDIFKDDEGGKGGIAGISDLIVIDKDGIAHIYDYKTSTKEEKEWSEAKKRVIDLQLAFYRQILRRSGIEVGSVNYIPINLRNYDFETKTVRDFDIARPVRLELGERSNVMRVVKKFMPHDITAKLQDVSSNKNIRDFLSEAFNYNDKNVVKEKVRVEDLIAKVKSTISNDGKSYVLFNAMDSSGWGNTYIPISSTDEKIEREVRSYLNDLDVYNSQLPVQFFDLVSYAKDQIAKNSEIDWESRWNRDAATITKLQNLLHKYIYDPAWQPIESDLLYDLGIVAFQNDDTDVIDFISLTANDISAAPEGLLKGKTVIGNFVPDHVAKQQELLGEVTNGDIELLKIYAMVKNNQETFGDKKIGKMFTLNMNDRRVIPDIKTQTMSTIDKYWKLLMKNIPSTLAVRNLDWEVSTIDYYESLTELITDMSAQKTLKINNLNRITPLVAQLKDTKNVSERIELLGKLQNQIMEGVDNNLNAVKHERKDIAGVLTLIAESITQLSNIATTHEEDMKQWSWLIDENMSTSTPDKIRNLAAATVVRLTKEAMNNAAHSFNSRVEEIRSIHAALYKDTTNAFKVKTVGVNQDVFKDLLEPAVDGVDYFRFKSPNDSSLTPVQSTYIRNYLSIINKVRTDRIIKKYGEDSAELAMFQGTAEYRNVPLMKTSGFSAFLGKDMKEFVNDYFREFINPQNIFKDDQDSEKKIKYQKEMYNQFDYVDLDYEKRVNELKNNKPTAFETDLEAIMAIYLMTNAKEEEYNKVLPKINAIKTLTMFNEINVFDETPNTYKFIEEYIATTVFGKANLAGESEGLAKTIGVASSLVSGFVMAASPISGATEWFTGFWGNVTRTLANVYDDKLFGKEDLRRAMMFVMGDTATTNKMSLDKISMCDSLNEMFRLSEMDMRQLAKEVQSTSSGLRHFKGKYMFWFNAFPSYLHRMSLFTAQMIKDGILKLDAIGNITKDSALTMKEGKMVYDPTKDDRFKVYLANKNANEATASDAWKESRAKYITIYNALEQEPGGIVNDKLARPYDNRMKDNLKGYSDKVHGNYDPDNKTRWQKTAFGRIFMQFKTWATAKKDRYYLSTAPSESEGNYEIQYDEAGQPVYVWKSKVVEGVYQSFIALAAELKANKYNVIKAWGEMSPTQKENFTWMISDLLLFGLLSLIVGLIMGELDSDDETSRALLRPLNNSIKDLYIGNTVGAFAGTRNPVAIFGWSAQVLNDSWGTLTGDARSADKLLDNIGVVRTISPLFASEE